MSRATRTAIRVDEKREHFAAGLIIGLAVAAAAMRIFLG